MDIIDISVTVIVNSIGFFTWIDPKDILDIFMRQIDPGVDYSYDDWLGFIFIDKLFIITVDAHAGNSILKKV